jgi:hypothetical protein
MMMRALKLPAFARYAEEIAQKAEREGWTFGRYLHHLAELEIHERRRRRTERYLRAQQVGRCTRLFYRRSGGRVVLGKTRNARERHRSADPSAAR